MGAIGRFEIIPIEDHAQIISTDFTGTVAGSHCALKHFRQRGKGTLINIATILGKIPAPLYASYAAAKFGIVGLSEALRRELDEDNCTDIHVYTVMPMAHETEFFEHAGNYTGHKAVPIPPVYAPQVTIDALVKLVATPEDEVITGRQGGIFTVLHRLMPGTVANFLSSKTKKSQLADAPEASISRGRIQPSASSTV